MSSVYFTQGLPEDAHYINNLDINSPEGLYLLQHLLTGSSWSSTHVPPTWELAASMGRLFERNIPHSRLRQLANHWISWAHKTLITVCGTWHTLLAPAEAKILADAGIIHTYPKGYKGKKTRRAF